MRLGKGADRIVAIALKTVKSGLHFIIDRVGKGLSDEQFHPLVDFLEEIILQHNGRVYVAFPATPELEDKLRNYIRLVREVPPASDHAWVCHDLIVEFKHTALDFYFRQSTDRLKVQGWVKKAVNVGLNIADSASNKPLKRVIPVLTDEALLSIADFYSRVMLEKH